MKTSDIYVKKYKIILIVGLLSMVVVFSLLFVEIPRPRSHKRLSPHDILQGQNLEVVWQRNDIYTNRAYSDNNSLQARDNKIFLVGNVEPFYPNYGLVLNAQDGKLIAKTEPVEGTFSFTTDGQAFYIGTLTPHELYKYDYQKGRRVWTHDMGMDKSPCCFRILGDELMTSWYFGLYRFSARDGSLLEKRYGDEPTFVLENGEYYQRSFDVQMQPVLRAGRLFIRKGHIQGTLSVIDWQTKKNLWEYDRNMISQIAVTPRRVYFLTETGYLFGLNVVTGAAETWVRFSPEAFFDFFRDQQNSYQVAYDDASGLVFLLLGDTGQLVAFREMQ